MRTGCAALAALTILAHAVPAQDPIELPAVDLPSADLQDDSVVATAPESMLVSSRFGRTIGKGDYDELPLMGGITVQWRDVVLRAQRGVILLERDSARQVGALTGSEDGLPTRGPGEINDKRLVTPEVLAQRLASLMRAAGKPDKTLAASGDRRIPLRLFRYLYLEGDVSVVRGKLEVIRCKSLTISPIDDRAVIDEGLLRLETFKKNPSGGRSKHIYTVRGDRIVRQGRRFLGSDLSVTTSTAGKPQFEVFTGLAEIVEAGDQFIIRSRDNRLAIGGIPLIPLPSVSIRTGEQNQFLIQGASAGYSNREGYQFGVDLGSSFNETGGAFHRWLTGRSAEEFRGDWTVGVGWVQQRGVPLDFGLTWNGGGIYEGSLEGFYLDDEGTNFREIVRDLPGNVLDNTSRGRLNTRNRIRFGENAELDVFGNWTTDEAILSEFFRSQYLDMEIPESGFDLRIRGDNTLVRGTGRWNLDDYTFNDRRQLTDRFVERSPAASFHLFSEELARTPWDTPVLLTTATEAGQFRSNFSEGTTLPVIDDSTLRVDQRVEIAAPFHLGPIGVRPYASARYTFFDETVAGGTEDRWGLETGVLLGTRMQRSWTWLDEEGEEAGMRHVILPMVRFVSRYEVSGDPADFHQFDETDALDENTSVRVEVLNVLEGMVDRGNGPRIENVLWVDLAQNFTPISERDNNGYHLGLFEYEVIVRPEFWWSPLPRLQFLFEGEHDWNIDEANTFNTQVSFGPVAGLYPSVGYRMDHLTNGTILYGLSTDLLGRWTLRGTSNYDLERSQTSTYSVAIVRQDLDWNLYFAVSYNNITDDTRFQVLFEPTLGGMIQTRRSGRAAIRPVYGASELEDL